MLVGPQLNVLPDETARLLFRRKAGRPFDIRFTVLRPGDVAEVYGESGSGKSELLMNAVCCTVTDAKPRIAIYCDHDGRLDLHRLETIIRCRLVR